MYATTDCRGAIDTFNAATRAFDAATRKLTSLSNAGGEPAPGQIAEWCDLSAEMNAAAAEAAAAVPETSEDAAAKLELAARAIEHGAFDGDGDGLAKQARAIATDLAGGQQDSAAAARLEQLTADSEDSASAFWRIYGFTCSGHGLEHLRSTLVGLTRPRLATIGAPGCQRPAESMN